MKKAKLLQLRVFMCVFYSLYLSQRMTERQNPGHFQCHFITTVIPTQTRQTPRHRERGLMNRS